MFDIAAVRSMLAIMFTCGMYDYSGEWAYRVGVPGEERRRGRRHGGRQPSAGHRDLFAAARSRGNSARGIEVCVELAARFGLHAFDCLNVGSNFLKAVL